MRPQRRTALRARIAACIAVAALAAPAGADEPPWRAAAEALSLPLTIVPATGAARALVVFFSGDGGWAAVDQAVSSGLAARGVATIGWSSLRYFSTTQSPARVAEDLRRLVRVLEPAGLPIFVGGYSFGAEVAPVVLAAEWSAAERQRIAGLLLLAPGASASFRVNPLDWIREPPVDPKHRIDDAARRLGGLRTLCVAGRDDTTSACGALADVPGVMVARVPGTHHFENGIPDVIDAAMTRLFMPPREER
jgi:type IV secretory pathway VirJ component